MGASVNDPWLWPGALERAVTASAGSANAVAFASTLPQLARIERAVRRQFGGCLKLRRLLNIFHFGAVN
jgi:hypothetical protein